MNNWTITLEFGSYNAIQYNIERTFTCNDLLLYIPIPNVTVDLDSDKLKTGHCVVLKLIN